MMKSVCILFLIVIFPLAGYSQESEDCRQATQLVIQAFDLGNSPSNFPEQKQLITKALELCPDHAEAHNNLGSVFEEEENYELALSHYKHAVAAKPDFAAAWFGIGEVYYKTGRFPLSLEAYLRACHSDKDARRRIEELLRENRYRVSEAGEILDKESLLLLFDKNRREKIRNMISECGFSTKAVVEPEIIFRNILFDVGTANLKHEAHAQIREIGAALQELGSKSVRISGHTDRQPFKGYSREDSDRMNMRLSEERAAAVAEELKKMGISGIQTKGYGPTIPIDRRDTQDAYTKNRRVVIEVTE
jgi:outer membrane protein OmpA-like peptidoglycan-associated protein